jgi:hypothetical protein
MGDIIFVTKIIFHAERLLCIFKIMGEQGIMKKIVKRILLVLLCILIFYAGLVLFYYYVGEQKNLQSLPYCLQNFSDIINNLSINWSSP